MNGHLMFWPRSRTRPTRKVLNYMGYANRKAGRFDVAFGYYKKALN
ncbi:MAG: hypothetical protein U1E15_12205 [Hyphomicrobiales bacterium]